MTTEFERLVAARLRARFDPRPEAIDRVQRQATSFSPSARHPWTNLGSFGALAAVLAIAVVAISAGLWGGQPIEPGSQGSTSPSLAASDPPTSGVGENDPDLPVNLPPLADSLLVVGYSDAYVKQAERTVEAAAALVILDSGVVFGNVGPYYFAHDYRTIRLTASDLRAWQVDLLDANLTTLSLPNPQAAGSGCADCSVIVIRTDVSGETVEVAIWGLITELRPGMSQSPTIPDGVVQIITKIESLEARLRGPDAEPWTGSVPTIPIAGYTVGG